MLYMGGKVEFGWQQYTGKTVYMAVFSTCILCLLLTAVLSY